MYFNSASRAHVDWLRALLHRLLGIDGYLEVRPARPPRHEFYRLKYGKHDSIKLLSVLYPSLDVPKLERKWRIWDDYARRSRTPKISEAVPTEGIEPSWACAHTVLNRAPVPNSDTSAVEQFYRISPFPQELSTQPQWRASGDSRRREGASPRRGSRSDARTTST